MAETFPTEIVTYTRSEVIEKYGRDYQFRVPEADVGPGTQPDVDANVMADQVMVLHADAVVIGNDTNLETSTGTAVDEQLRINGLGSRLPATGATGYVTITASVGGVNILAGSELKTKVTQLRYASFATGLYQDGDQVLIGGVDTGPATNQEPGIVLVWTSPPSGLATECVVFEQSNGTGLTNGRAEETDQEAIQRIIDARANPPAAGNSAQYIEATEATPGLAIQKAFAYPASPNGPGNISIAFMLRPATQARAVFQVRRSARSSRRTSRPSCRATTGSSIWRSLRNHSPSCSAWRGVRRRSGGQTPRRGPVQRRRSVLVKAAPSPTALSVRVVTGTNTPVPRSDRRSRSTTLRQACSCRSGSRRSRSWLPTRSGRSRSTRATPHRTRRTSRSRGQIVGPYSDSLNDLTAPVIAYVDTMGPGRSSRCSRTLDSGSDARPLARGMAVGADEPGHHAGARGRVGRRCDAALSDRTVSGPCRRTWHAGLPVRLDGLRRFPGVRRHHDDTDRKHARPCAPRRPTIEDLGGVAKENDAKFPPNPVTQPTAEDWNEKTRMLAAAWRTVPVAVIPVTFVAGAPTIGDVQCGNPALVAGDFYTD